MKDYEEKVINIMDSAKDSIRTQLDKAYKSGYEDAKSEIGQNAIDLAHEESDRAYQQGLEDAWEAAKKICEIPVSERDTVFDLRPETDSSLYNLLYILTIQEAIAKIKEYEEKQDAEIKVGDEVVSKLGKKGVVITDVPSENGYISIWFSASTHVQLYLIKDLVKTGKHYDQIAEVFAEMRGEE